MRKQIEKFELNTLLEAAADARPEVVEWLSETVVKVKLENGLVFEVTFSALPADGEGGAPALWGASVAGCKPASPSSVGWWLARVWGETTPDERDADLAVEWAERRDER